MLRPHALAGAVAIAAMVASAFPAFAQSDPAAQSLIDRLRPKPGGSTRGIRLPGETTPAGTAPASAPAWSAAPIAPRPAALPPRTTTAVVGPLEPARETTSDAPSVSITITFPTGSAALTPDAERALAPLGRALASPDLAPYRFRIEGHTDTVGDAAGNQALSERRAAAVREYLARTFGVDPVRLVAVGFGASQLLVPTAPQVPEARNRRVQVVNLGS